MAIFCDITISPTASAGQFKELGAALWRWCTRIVGKAGIYQYLDNQVLADLIDGRLVLGMDSWQRGFHLGIWDAVSPDPQAAIDNLRREVPEKAVEDILVNGVRWHVGGNGPPVPLSQP